MDEQLNPKDPRHSELVDINRQVFDQNQRIKNIHKVAAQTQETTNKIGTELSKQRQVINNNIDQNKEIKNLAKLADKKTREMIRRNFCIKLTLWIVIVVLFAANVGLIVWKANKAKQQPQPNQ